MNAETRELFRKALLRILDARSSDRFGLREAVVPAFLDAEGFRHAGHEDTAAELQYLCDKGFVVLVGKTISPENRCWRITAAGRDFAAENF